MSGIASTKTYNNICLSNLGEVISVSIQSAINLILIIGGFIVLFSVIVSMLINSHILNMLADFISPLLSLLSIPKNYANGIIIGLIEVTNGIKSISFINNAASQIICSFLLGFGGISVLLQVFSITSKAKISIKPYIIGKTLQAIISCILMYLCF